MNVNLSLRIASANGDLEEGRRLVEEAGARVNATDKGGVTPLMWACRFGRLEVVKWLLEAGADVNVADEDGWTALFWASFKGHLEVVDLLQAKGVDTAGA
jgi:ankyrin repeat protein